MDTVNYEKRAPIASITINRPHVMNACDPPTTDYIYECEQNFDQDPDLKVLILTGTGERAFCTGMDLKAAAARIAEGGPVSNVVPPYMKTEKITIAAVNGYAVAGGLERALACDIRIASENAQFGCFEIRRGIPNPPDPLIRLIGFGPALHMLLSGDVFHAEEALRFGLVTKVVPPSELMSDRGAEGHEKGGIYGPGHGNAPVRVILSCPRSSDSRLRYKQGRSNSLRRAEKGQLQVGGTGLLSGYPPGISGETNITITIPVTTAKPMKPMTATAMARHVDV